MTHIQVPLAEMQVGDQLAHIVRIKSVSMKQGKKPWIALLIGDKSGNSFQAKKWGEGNNGTTDDELKKYQNINVALVTGVKQVYDNKESFVLKSIAQVADDFPPTTLQEVLGDESLAEKNSSEKPSGKEKEDGSALFKTKAEVNFDALVKTQKPLRECAENETLNHMLRICSMSATATKQGIPVIDFMLGDATSQPVKARLWRTSDALMASLKDAKVAYITTKTEVYPPAPAPNSAMQIKLDGDQIVIVSDVTEADINSLILSSPYPIKTLANGIWEIVQSFQDPMLKKLCESLLKDPKNKNFRFVPAGLSYHHSWRSGLIEHTYRLLLLLDDFVKSYNSIPFNGNLVSINRDTVLTIGLYHDFFKHVEYTVDCGYAPEGNLLKHLSRGVLDVGARTSQIDNFPEMYRTVIAHGIGAHHGKKEWDTIDTPACPEALIVHWFDNLCSKLDPTLTELNLLKGESKFSTNRLKTLSSIPYLGGCKLGSATPFNPVTLPEIYSEKDLKDAIALMLGLISDKFVKELCLSIFDSEMGGNFQSKRMAFSEYTYGSYEYIFRTMVFIGNFVNSYNLKGWPGNNIYLDSDYLVGGAFLQSCFLFKKGDSMLEDVGSCLLAIGKTAAKIPNFPGDIRDLMAQIVASKGEGAPESPICPESIINHYLSHLLLYLDSMSLILSSVESAPGGESNSVIPMFGKKITLGTCGFKE